MAEEIIKDSAPFEVIKDDSPFETVKDSDPFAASVKTAPAKPKPDHSSMTVGPDGSIYYRDPKARKEFREGVESGVAGMASGAAQRPLGIAQYVTSYLPEALGGNKAGDKLAEWERSLQAVGDPEAQKVGGGIFDVATLEPVLRLGGAAWQGAKNIPETARKLFTREAPKAAEAVAVAPKVAEVAETLTPDKVTKLNTALDTLKDYSVKSMKSGAVGGLAGFFQGATTARGEKTEEERAKHRRIDELWGTVIGAGIGLPLPIVLEGGPAAWRQLTGKNLTEARTALEQYLEDVRKAITGKTGEAISAETAKGAAEAETLAAAQAKLTSQEQEVARAQRALEEIEKGRGKQVPTGRSDTGEIITGTRAEAQAFDPSALSETQRKVYETATKKVNDVKSKLTELQTETKEIISGREDDFVTQIAELKKAEDQIKALTGDVTPGASILDRIKPSITPANEIRVNRALENLTKDAEKTAASIIKAQETAAATREPGIEGGKNAMKILAGQEEAIEGTIKKDSGLADIFVKNKDKTIPAQSIISIIDEIIPNTAVPELEAALARQRSKIEKEMDATNGTITPELADSVQRFFTDAIDSGLVSVSGGTKAATGGERVNKLMTVRDETQRAINKVIPEYELARQKFAQLAEGRRPFSVGNIFHGLTETEVAAKGAEKIFATAPVEAMDQIVKMANKGKEGLAGAVKDSPELREAFRPYFNDKLFGKLGTKPVTGEAMVKNVEENAKALQDLGLYDEFKRLAQERLTAEKQITNIQTARSEVKDAFSEMAERKQLESAVAEEEGLKQKQSLAERAKERTTQVAQGKEEPSLIDPAKPQVPGGVKYQSPEDVRKAQIRGKGLKPVDIEAKTKADIARLEKQRVEAQGNIQKLTEVAQTAEREMKRATKAVSDLTRFKSRIETTRPKELINKIDGYLNEMSTEIIDDQAYRALREEINTAKAEYERLQDAEKFSFRVRAVLGSVLTGYTATASGFGRFLHNLGGK